MDNRNRFVSRYSNDKRESLIGKLKEKYSSKIGRILVGAGIIGILAGVSCHKKDSDKAKVLDNKKPPIEKNIGPIVEEIKDFGNSKTYDLRNLSRFNINLSNKSLILKYLYGKEVSELNNISKIPDEMEINFRRNLNDLWQQKIRKNQIEIAKVTKKGRLKRASLLEKENADTIEFYNTRVLPYIDGTKKVKKTDITSFKKEMKKGIGNVLDNIDLREVAIKRGIKNPERQKLFEDICKSTRDIDLLAYNFTELFDIRNGEFNNAMMDFLLKNSGKEYVMYIPALGDGFLSYGPFQNTGNVISETGSSVKIDKMGKKRLIPTSMKDLDDLDHHEAAFYNAIYNLSTLIKNMNSKQFKTLSDIWTKNNASAKDNIMQYVAGAHNNPTAATRGFKAWLDKKGKGNVYEYIRNQAVKGYSKKSKANRDFLKKK